MSLLSDLYVDGFREFLFEHIQVRQQAEYQLVALAAGVFLQL